MREIKNWFTYSLPTAFEVLYLGLSFVATPPLPMAIIAFPAVFVFPGVMLLLALGKKICSGALRLVVEGFFVSTIISVIVTSFLLAGGLSLTQFSYSLAALSIVSIATAIGFARKIELKPSKHEVRLLTLAFAAYTILMPILSTLPRSFTPDETSYIFSARMGILSGTIPPMGIRPDASAVTALLNGRLFWNYLLTTFLGSTGLPAYQAGLIGVGFLIMTALAASLIVKNRNLSLAVFGAVVINPMLLSFSVLTLNDLAISFYAVFAVLFFIKTFSKTDNGISISIANLSFSLISVAVLTLIKPNLLLFSAMWIILVFTMLRYKLYKTNRKHKILFTGILLPVVVYELFIDVPYVLSVWVFRSITLGNLFSKFLIASPIEHIAGWFTAPWWSPTAPTIFNHTTTDLLEYFYRILSPEHSSLLISAFILALPIFMLVRNMRKDLEKNVLTSLVVLPLVLSYFDALSSQSLSDVSRYSLWMLPLWIPLALITLQYIFNESSYRGLFPILIAAVILLWINVSLSRTLGGIYVGYFLASRSLTLDALMIQLISIIVGMGLLFFKEDLIKIGSVISRKISVPKMINIKTAVLCIFILLILANGLYFSTQFTLKSQLLGNSGLNAINDAFNFTGENELVFGNNYINLRPYVSNPVLQQGLLLPPPDTKDDFLRLLEVAPTNTTISISTDSATSWYEYANNYIKNYSNSYIITPEKPDDSLLPNLDLPNPVLKMTFDDSGKTTISDYSGFGNDGTNYGATFVVGYYGQALQFSGQQYVSTRTNSTLNVGSYTTISLLAMIGKADPSQGYMILSKGYAPENGSYDVFVWDGRLYYELGNIGSLSVDARSYIDSWHNFVFTYDGNEMEIYVDGSPAASKPASGAIRVSSYNLEIGRDSERESFNFVGVLDDLQISNMPLNRTWLVDKYYSSYALRIRTTPLTDGQATLFRVINRNVSGTQNVTVKDPLIGINQNRTVLVEMQVDAPKSENATILIATDRFTKVYDVTLHPGPNNLKFEFAYIVDPSWYEAGGHYWLHLAQTRIIVIQDGSIVSNKFVTTQDPQTLHFLLLTLSLVILAVYLVSHFKYRHSAQ